MDVVDYAERIETPGFVFMNTPGYDPVSLTGLAAGGCNLIAFTTGRGSAIGFPTIPVIKIATNSNTYRRMRDNMDINAGRIADGEAHSGRSGAGDLRYAAARWRRARRTSPSGWGTRNSCPGASVRFCSPIGFELAIGGLLVRDPLAAR